ncbi:MAG: YfhL family 4Fe-4S dicluster ferredoxin [SAR324 cluster bacterium]|nr:YfhL family 4Fe-4S dicluster ferredoxin [SAR324 cluster bacterium]
MALMITEDCTVCDACIEPCPNEAITAGEEIFVIDALRCSECIGTDEEPQCIEVCPSDCIIPNPDFEESEDELQEKYEMIHG